MNGMEWRGCRNVKGEAGVCVCVDSRGGLWICPLASIYLQYVHVFASTNSPCQL